MIKYEERAKWFARRYATDIMDGFKTYLLVLGAIASSTP